MESGLSLEIVRDDLHINAPSEWLQNNTLFVVKGWLMCLIEINLYPQRVVTRVAVVSIIQLLVVACKLAFPVVCTWFEIVSVV